jgi:ABC-type branched-subunit amino acid transport system ATPase component
LIKTIIERDLLDNILFRAEEIGDRVGIMQEGRLAMERTREELQHRDLVEIYIDYTKLEPLKMSI